MYIILLSAQSKFAVIIGNGDYINLENLKHPEKDTTKIAETLEKSKFQVELLINCNLISMEDALYELQNNLSAHKENIGFFYYAGHAVQSYGQNYLIPADADIKSEGELNYKTLSVQWILDDMSKAGNKLNIIVLDASHENPFTWSKAKHQYVEGLYPIKHQPPESIVVYSAQPGRITTVESNPDNLFTNELIQHLNTPELDISEIFSLTKEGVQTASNGSQVPEVYTKFAGEVSLVP